MKTIYHWKEEYQAQLMDAFAAKLNVFSLNYGGSNLWSNFPHRFQFRGTTNGCISHQLPPKLARISRIYVPKLFSGGWSQGGRIKKISTHFHDVCPRNRVKKGDSDVLNRPYLCENASIYAGNARKICARISSFRWYIVFMGLNEFWVNLKAKSQNKKIAFFLLPKFFPIQNEFRGTTQRCISKLQLFHVFAFSLFSRFWW